MNLLRLLLGSIVVLIIGGVFWSGFRYFQRPRQVHYHAGFQIYIDGQKQDFSSDTFMHADVCRRDPSATPPIDLVDKVHLHDNVGDVAHIHAVAVTWSDLFTYLQLDQQLVATGAAYINGQSVTHISSQVIKPYDRAVILLGSYDPNVSHYLESAVTMSHILAIEKMKEFCGK